MIKKAAVGILLAFAALLTAAYYFIDRVLPPVDEAGLYNGEELVRRLRPLGCAEQNGPITILQDVDCARYFKNQPSADFCEGWGFSCLGLKFMCGERRGQTVSFCRREH